MPIRAKREQRAMSSKSPALASGVKRWYGTVQCITDGPSFISRDKNAGTASIR
jgi:hypothetical protein